MWTDKDIMFWLQTLLLHCFTFCLWKFYILLLLLFISSFNFYFDLASSCINMISGFNGIIRLRLLCQQLTLRRSFGTNVHSPIKPALLQWQLFNHSVNRCANRCINTTTESKERQKLDVYDPNYVDSKRPKGPETVRDFADVNSQKVWFLYLMCAELLLKCSIFSCRIGFHSVLILLIEIMIEIHFTYLCF